MRVKGANLVADVPVRTSRGPRSEPGLADYEPGDPGVVIGRTWIDVPGSELDGYWVRDQAHANEVWTGHYGTGYPGTGSD